MTLKYEQFWNNERGTYVFPLSYLESLPTLAIGQADDLKIDTGSMRVWLCRCGEETPYYNQVSVEHYYPEYGRWKETATYTAK